MTKPYLSVSVFAVVLGVFGVNGATPPPPLSNVVPPIESTEHLVRNPEKDGAHNLPIVVPPFEEHVRDFHAAGPGDGVLALGLEADGTLHAISPSAQFVQGIDGAWSTTREAPSPSSAIEARAQLQHELGQIPRADWKRLRALLRKRDITAYAFQGDTLWFADSLGLYRAERDSKPERHPRYGIDGPASTHITGLAFDSQGTLWAGTASGLSLRRHDGSWTTLRGKDGLPIEEITAIAVDGSDRLWIGTEHGLVHYRPYEPGRQWFYRAGGRYLPGDQVSDVVCSADGKTVFTWTNAGLGRLDAVTTTLLERAQTIERLVNERHRRLGLVAECTLNDAINPTSHTISDIDNDGLWTAYHVAAMSLCFGATGDPAAKESARTGMHALYMLQDASGIPGLVARSVLPPELGKEKDTDKPEDKRQWRPTPDGTMYWKSDTSSDEIDGHYLAFYTYYEHIAQHDPEEKARIVEQVREVTDYIVDNNYQLIDWDGERTRWGFWNPEALNETRDNYLEHGLNALQILSFLKVAHYVTGDEKYDTHYRKLIYEHRYLDNVLLSKKLFPDSYNHSDDQLGYVAWYPILQLEKDPVLAEALHLGQRRHYFVVAPKRPSFYAFVHATIAPNETDLESAIEQLKRIPTDRRVWGVKNSIRDDVHFAARPNRFGRPVLDSVLPVDERVFEKWNKDPYEPDREGEGLYEDDGAAYLLPYWMGRYHGLITEQP